MACHVKWTRGELYIFNGSKRVIYVNLGDGTPTYALDSGATGIITRKKLGGVAGKKNTLVTLAYYTKTHDLVTVVLQDSGTWTTSMTERLDAHDVARECVSWVREEYKNLITVVEETRELYGAEIQYMIEPIAGSDPVLLVGVGGSAKSVRIIAYPSRAVHLTFEKVGGVDDLLPVDHAALAAKLDVDHEFSIFRGPLVVEPDGPEQECLHGFYNPSDPAFIKAVLLELLGFNVRD